MHNMIFDATSARTIHRLIVGGQGLMGGDPAIESAPTTESCCPHCLRQRRRCVESLWYVAYQCEVYSKLMVAVREVVGVHPRKIFILSRCQWNGSQLRAILRFLQGLINERTRIMGTCVRSDAKISDEIERLWDGAED